ncbi:MAG: hypothetical protein ASARMPRED_000899 [Alectoria sarmentosa]|nr:MAG: hypothetical protein ASARMPRED_000899 [Alectoria sarmentosa]
MMVYRGKPSKACLECRNRKLRCDLRRGSCGQCIRATLECSGYRDTEQLRVRNETQTTKQKALARRPKFVPPSLTIALDDRARNAFFSHYVSGFSKTYDVLESLYKQCPKDRPLTASVDAVSLAFFSFQFGCTQASQVAREKYLHALSLLNRALKSPESVTSDSTLLAVLLLDLFEKITNNNPRSIGSWMSHINGALALVERRKAPSLQDYTGLRLSARLTTNLLISCISANTPVPPALVELRSDLEPFINKEDPKWQISGLVVKYANLKGATQDGCVSSPNIIARATALDLEFLSLAKRMPSTWLYNPAYVEKASERVFEKRYDIYPDHFVTQGWNVLRVMRILLNDIIRTYRDSKNTSPFNDGPSSPKSSIAAACIDEIAKGICATAPQFTGYETTTPRSKAYCTTQRLRCYTLLFPLYVAGLYASSTTQIKPWIVKQLRFMSNEIGIPNAKVVAEILERGGGTCPWDVYAVLGSYAFAA